MLSNYWLKSIVAPVSPLIAMKDRRDQSGQSERRLGLLLIVMTVIAAEARTSCGQPSPPAAVVTAAAENPRTAEFRIRDRDQDGTLTETEYANGAEPDRPLQRREFKVFDEDLDGQMSLAEFLTVPAGQAEDVRGILRDPVVQLSQTAFAELSLRGKKCDLDQDGQLSKSEFAAAELGPQVRGLGNLSFEEWDLNSDFWISHSAFALPAASRCAPMRDVWLTGLPFAASPRITLAK